MLIIGSGTAATNAAKTAVASGAKRVVLVQKPELINTCVEEGCMPSKSVLAGAHQGETMEAVMDTKDAHIERLLTALTDGITAGGYEVVPGEASFVSEYKVLVRHEGYETLYTAERIIIATGSVPFVPPIPGLDTLGDRLWLSDDLVAKESAVRDVPKRVLTIGAGPIGLELSTFLHDMGTEVIVLNRSDRLLPAMDEEFGAERVRGAEQSGSFTIALNASLREAKRIDGGVECRYDLDGEERTELFDYVLVATGRKPNLDSLNLDAVDIARTERGGIEHDDTLKTSLDHVYVAGDVTGHHQILHFAAEMGKRAAANALHPAAAEPFTYDDFMLAVSFDEFPSGLIGLTEAEATKRGLSVVTATRYFNSIGLGILKRQEIGLWKLVAEATTGRIVGAQVLGPASAGELLQLLVPVLANQNTAADIVAMTWYHPTYAEILHSLARDIAGQLKD